MVEEGLEPRCTGCLSRPCFLERIMRGPGKDQIPGLLNCYLRYIALCLEFAVWELSRKGQQVCCRTQSCLQSVSLHRVSLLPFWSRSDRWMSVKCLLCGCSCSSLFGVIVRWQWFSLTCLPHSSLIFRDSYPMIEFRILGFFLSSGGVCGEGPFSYRKAIVN